jgi:uncharacterized protein DUF6468
MIPDLTFSIGLDVLTALLLIATIAYAVSLNRKLNLLRDNKSEMEAVIARLIEATGQARTGLEGLRAHAVEVGERLQQGLKQSSGRVDELAFLIERAEKLSERLEGSIAASRAPQASAPAAVASPCIPHRGAPPAGPGQRDPSREPAPEEASLLKSLQGMR